MQKQTSRLIRGTRQKNLKLIIVLKVAISFYLFMFIINYLTDSTSAYFSTIKSVQISIHSLVEEENDTKEEIETRKENIEEEDDKSKDAVSSDREKADQGQSITNTKSEESNIPTEQQLDTGIEKVEESVKSPLEQSAPQEKSQTKEPKKEPQVEVPAVKGTDSSKTEKVQ